MFCEKCGAPNDDTAKVCGSCGAELAETATPETGAPAPAPVEESSILSKILKIAVPAGAAIVAFIILACAGIFKPAHQKVLEKYVNSMVKANAKAYCEVAINPYDMEQAFESDFTDYENKKEMIEYYQDYLDEEKEELEDEYGKNLRAKIKIKDVKKYTRKEIKALNEYISDLDYDGYDGNKILQDIRVVKAKITIKGSEDDESNTDEFVVYKTKGKWYCGSIVGLYDKSSIKEAIKSVKD